MTRIFLFFVLLGISACALPTEYEAPDSFVSLEEQQAIKFIKFGDDFFLKGRYVDAELEYLKALYLYSDYDNIRVDLVNVLIRQGLFDESLEQLNILIEKSPNNPDLLLLKAFYYSEMQEYDLAIKSYNQTLENLDSLKNIVELKKYKELIFNNLSTIQFKIGLEDEAIESAFQAYMVNKNYFQKSRLAKLQIATGRENIFYDDLSEFERLNSQKIKYVANYLIILFLKEEFNTAKNLSARIKEITGYSISLTPQVELINYILNEKEDIESGKEEINEKTEEFLENINKNEQIKLYWPVGLLEVVGEQTLS